MAVKASASITLNSVVDIKATYRYYLLQSSTLSKPTKPITNPPSSSWDDSEPNYVSGSTNSLYYVDLTVFSDDTFSYSEVSLSTAYEAAKEAYNKAQNAQDTANNAQSNIDNLEVGGRNLLLNSSFITDTDKWDTANAEITTIDNVTCGHIIGVLEGESYVRQNIKDKLDWSNLEQEYVYSADIKLDNFVKGDTSPYLGLHFSGQYDNNGSVAYLGAETVDGNPYLESYNGFGWVRISWVVKFDRELDLLRVHIYGRDFTGDVHFKNLKLEKGNKATDWTPAPEDVEEDITNIQESANNAQTTANDNIVRINDAQLAIDGINALIANLVQGQNGETLMTQTEDGWVFNFGAYQSQLDNATNGVDNLNTEMSLTNEQIAVLGQNIADLGVYTDYIKFGVEDGQPSIILGETDSAFKVIITNTEIRFMEGSTIPASISNKTLNIEKAVIKEELKQGGFAWVSRSNGNYGLVWKGE